MPGSSAHIRSHKQTHSRTLSEQRKYREGMASSTIFTSSVMGGVTGEDESAQGMGPIWEFFVNEELPLEDLLTEGDEFSYPFGRRLA